MVVALFFWAQRVRGRVGLTFALPTHLSLVLGGGKQLDENNQTLAISAVYVNGSCENTPSKQAPDAIGKELLAIKPADPMRLIDHASSSCRRRFLRRPEGRFRQIFDKNLVCMVVCCLANLVGQARNFRYGPPSSPSAVPEPMRPRAVPWRHIPGVTP